MKRVPSMKKKKWEEKEKRMGWAAFVHKKR